jgi:uncharacterized protein YecE (DUF72 family)
MTLRTGTSGFSYKQWKGSFYPEKLAAREMLAYYAQQLPAVEINSTFYRMPKAELLETWAGQVPEDFRFVLKASRRITHMKRLKDTEDETSYLLKTVAHLGARLGALLVQLPPNMKCNLERLQRFSQGLPADVRVAFEFRHESWLCDGVFDVLRERNHGLCLADVEAEGDDGEGVGTGELVSTADWGYLRLRRDGYDRAQLADWARRVAAQGWRDSFVFLKHEEQGPRLAATLQELAAAPGAKKVGTPARKVAASAEDDAKSA